MKRKIIESSASLLLALSICASSMLPARADGFGKHIFHGLATVAEDAGIQLPDRLETGKEAEASARKLTTELSWYRSLPEAEAAARAENKPIFWMHMLGDIDGKT